MIGSLVLTNSQWRAIIPFISWLIRPAINRTLYNGKEGG